MWNIVFLTLYISAEIEAQKSEVTCPRTHSSAVVEPSAQPRQATLKHSLCFAASSIDGRKREEEANGRVGALVGPE